MKKLFISIVSFLLMSTIVFGSASPIVAFAVNDMYLQNSSDESITSNDSDFVSSALDVSISERYHIIKNGYREQYDLQEGTFGLQATDQENIQSVYFYSDGYFAETPDKYNPSLSTMSLSLALSAFNTIQTDFDMDLPSGEYSNLFRHAKQLLSDIGIKEKDIFVNDGFSHKPTKDTIGMIMGAKQISIEGETKLLIPIVVRGGDYESEWASNVTVGESGESYGFSSAAAQVVEQVKEYINNYRSFDISSALNEGNVRFWVVGYSRGGAVANITSKRLTDMYGEKGNSVYGYCFEAPNGGVDSAEIKQPWTYNGVYSNIHNIINPNDLVTMIPPKQMGFKRYGVDHYIPGTDAGEITTTTYETPTGVTVTTYADNVAYVVGDEDYDKRRVDMLSYLKAIDSNVDFSDEFVIGRIDFFEAIKGNGLLIPIEEGKNITASQWLECFIRDLLTWAATRNDENGIPNKDYRDFYTSQIEYVGKEYVPLEIALQTILDIAFGNQRDEEFLFGMLYRLLSLLVENLTVIDLYFNVIQGWDKLSEEKQTKYLDKMWNCLNKDMTYSDGTPVKKLIDVADADDYELLKDSVYTLSAFLFSFASKDYKTSPDFDNFNAAQIHIITLIYNVNTVAQGHYPEVCLAWLSTYDSNYTSENSKYAGKNINLINDDNTLSPQIEMTVDVGEKESTVSLSAIIKTDNGVDKNTVDNGSSIYYAIYENKKMVGGWQLYRSPIVLDTTKDTEYTIKTFAARFEERSDKLLISDEVLRTPPKMPDPPVDENPGEDPKDNSNGNFVQIIAIVSSASLLVALAIVFIVKKRKAINK